MKRNTLTIGFLFFCLLATAGNSSTLLDELEKALLHRDEYSAKKEARIDSLKQLTPESDLERFRLYNDIYTEYYIYRFDSAMTYVDRQEEIAGRLGNDSCTALCAIHRSMLLSTSGHFCESVATLDALVLPKLPQDLLPEYYTAYEWAYSMWAEYSNDNTYAPLYYEKEMEYQEALIGVLRPDSKEYNYWKAENLYRKGRYAEAESFYQKALEGVPVNIRLYAMITYGLALTYKQQGKEQAYEDYLMKAAISDMICPLKENLALQELSLYIYNNKTGETARANRYLTYSMEDAIFYNNRLRMLEIANKFPSIVVTYQQENLLKSKRLRITLVCISLLSVGLLLSLAFIYKQMNQIRMRRRKLSEMNKQLQALNRELLDTNRTREGYVSLFMDLCAAYIEKMNHYQDLVKRKVKARQTDDLLKPSYSNKLSEADAKEFFMNFDTAFLTLYPNFIEEFNALLQEDGKIIPKKGEILNTELRIFALIRIGIKDSSKIATLLFYSPQTIYNYRSAVKNRAVVRENFEKQVEGLCPTV